MRSRQKKTAPWAGLAQAFKSFFKLQSLKKFVALFVIGTTLSFAIAACGGNNATTASNPNSASPVANTAKNVHL
ncbi:MAG: hypothetical protein MUC48_14110 [Leptolyngbya sp. Prado105]|jgi:sulfate transport system substrate-binding protein|nr:hypothetical protein [Leptolyngbya sp. Prado105]